jgi:hypothetical protein
MQAKNERPRKSQVTRDPSISLMSSEETSMLNVNIQMPSEGFQSLYANAAKSPVSAQTIARSASTICHLDFVIWHFHECRLPTRRDCALSNVSCDCAVGAPCPYSCTNRLSQRVSTQHAVRPVRVTRIGEELLEKRQAVRSEHAGEHRYARIPK